MSENISPQFTHILTVLERVEPTSHNKRLESHLIFFDELSNRIRNKPYHHFKNFENGTETPKIEIWLYTMSAAKSLTIGAIELLGVGSILLERSRDAFGDNQGFCKAIISFLVEALEITGKMYVTFSEFEQAVSYYEILCREICSISGISFDQIRDELLQN